MMCGHEVFGVGTAGADRTGFALSRTEAGGLAGGGTVGQRDCELRALVDVAGEEEAAGEDDAGATGAGARGSKSKSIKDAPVLALGEC